MPYYGYIEPKEQNIDWGEVLGWVSTAGLIGSGLWALAGPAMAGLGAGAAAGTVAEKAAEITAATVAKTAAVEGAKKGLVEGGKQIMRSVAMNSLDDVVTGATKVAMNSLDDVAAGATKVATNSADDALNVLANSVDDTAGLVSNPGAVSRSMPNLEPRPIVKPVGELPVPVGPQAPQPVVPEPVVQNVSYDTVGDLIGETKSPIAEPISDNTFWNEIIKKDPGYVTPPDFVDDLAKVTDSTLPKTINPFNYDINNPAGNPFGSSAPVPQTAAPLTINTTLPETVIQGASKTVVSPLAPAAPGAPGVGIGNAVNLQPLGISQNMQAVATQGKDIVLNAGKDTLNGAKTILNGEGNIVQKAQSMGNLFREQGTNVLRQAQSMPLGNTTVGDVVNQTKDIAKNLAPEIKEAIGQGKRHIVQKLSTGLMTGTATAAASSEKEDPVVAAERAQELEQQKFQSMFPTSVYNSNPVKADNIEKFVYRTKRSRYY